MCHRARLDRRDEKHSAILNFLGDFEVFTSVQIVAQLLDVSDSSARRALSQLVKVGLLQDERHFIDGHQVSIYGITQAGIAAADLSPPIPTFSCGRVKSAFINHKLELQRLRIISENLGAIWSSERYVRFQRPGLKKIPDAACSISVCDQHIPGIRHFVELEIGIKTSKRYVEILKNHLFNIEAEQITDGVLYVFPQRLLAGATKLLNSIPLPPCPPRDNLANLRQYRFMVGSIENFPNDFRYLNGSKVNFSPCVPQIPDVFE